jgi:predicted RNase H-like HicB family nuclease
MSKEQRILSEESMRSRGRDLVFRGFIKPEEDQFVAICIDLDIVGQGSTPDEAAANCAELVQEYVEFVLENHANRIHEYIPRRSPEDLIKEYDSLFTDEVLQRCITTKPRVKRKEILPANRVANYVFDGRQMTVCPA